MPVACQSHEAARPQAGESTFPHHDKWGYTDGKTILYEGHGEGAVPVSNGLSDSISRDLKKRGFKYIGAVTIYSHLQACGVINDHASDCPCYARINENWPTIRLAPDCEVRAFFVKP